MITIKKGQWYSICCHEDLTQADEDFEYDTEELGSIKVYETRREALTKIAENWYLANCPVEFKECLDLIQEDEDKK